MKIKTILTTVLLVATAVPAMADCVLIGTIAAESTWKPSQFRQVVVSSSGQVSVHTIKDEDKDFLVGADALLCNLGERTSYLVEPDILCNGNTRGRRVKVMSYHTPNVEVENVTPGGITQRLEFNNEYLKRFLASKPKPGAGSARIACYTPSGVGPERTLHDITQ
ncbi:MAG: hypothetical protein WAX89_02235 [Alphaproteobacteria bacterium]